MGLEVASTFEHPLPYHLYRSLIGVLNDGGVKDQVFLDLQDSAIRATKDARTSLTKAARLMVNSGLGTAFHLPSLFANLEKMLCLDLDESDPRNYLDDPFIKTAIEYAVVHVLRLIKHKTRIGMS